MTPFQEDQITIRKLREEIERLKEALRRINNCAAKHKYDAMAMRDIASAALEGKI